VVGDFNAHHSCWEGRGSAPTGGGQLLADHLLESNLCLLNDGSITRMPDQANHRPTAIDIAMISSDLFASTVWEMQEDTLESDHFPILIHINDITLAKSTNDDVSFNYKQANWSLFYNILQHAEYPEANNDSIDSHYECLRRVILAAADKAIPKRRKPQTKFSPNPWWNQQCEAAVRRKRKAFTKYKRNPTIANATEVKISRLECKRTIALAKKEHWTKFLSEKVTDYKDTKLYGRK
jgi:hypothetical protein